MSGRAPDWLIQIASSLINIFALLGIFLTLFALISVLERKILGRMQVRYGPNRVGPFGLLQPIADGIKLALKEDIVPSQANIWVHTVAPIMSLVPALIIFAVIPIGPSIPVGGGPGGQPWTWYIANINVSYLYVAAIASLGVYG